MKFIRRCSRGDGNSLTAVSRALVAAVAVATMQGSVANAQATVAEAIANNTDFNFSVLASLLDQADLLDTVDSTPNLTLFAPIDAAFEKLDSDFVSNLTSDEYKTHLQDVLLSHVILDNVMSSDMITADETIESASGLELVFGLLEGNVTVNGGSVVVSKDIPADNPAIIHAVDNVIAPTWFGKKILDVADATARFNNLLTLVKIHDEVASLVRSDASFTLFGPSDDAFSALFAEKPKLFDIFLGDFESGRKILEVHVVEGVFAADMIPEGQSVIRSVFDEPLLVVKNGTSITVNGVAVAQADILASNGVIHEMENLIEAANFSFSDLVSEVPTRSPTVSPTSNPTELSGSRSLGTQAPTTAPTTSGGATAITVMFGSAFTAAALATLVASCASL